MKNKTIKIALITGSIALTALITGCCNPSSQASNNNEHNHNDEITIYFARHGKTLFNTYDLVQGWADSPLTDKGIEVARYLGEGFKNKQIQFDAYYTSDAGRQRETMQVLLRQKGIQEYQIQELKELREVFYGGFEGGSNTKMVSASMKALGYKSVNNFYKSYAEGQIPVATLTDAIAKSDPKHEAENFEQVKERTQNALKSIIKTAQEKHQKNVLAISSGMSMQVMISDLTDDPIKNKPLSNASVVKIVYQNGKYRVVEIGNMDYVNLGKSSLNK
ncbi:histidine phosphatase family protein [Gilliamella sp. B2776]|uniref:histidine phosphatase family protein n=1 Tax=unclassified Gilliamella TaxID=2685620 RepID=UPI002269ABA3|nr:MULTISPECIES: histidine phosphatase family protein [unclassified Gilliamella]MCX8650438.1 histidine phosphatase family protein [Gilliamella sp. B2779]MCX8654516.1 histidine phosphatase family protein [Gilliamella sp. B2737]MCX8692286.1 histidine phosphatase family protein [Gilliamella sp. B2776]MCX8703512.1 histidine phosphatase family protein [Gilliamella sp. B2781]WDM18945.1 histidine phosphatase family protein [Gilliamella sp. B3022]